MYVLVDAVSTGFSQYDILCVDGALGDGVDAVDGMGDTYFQPTLLRQLHRLSPSRSLPLGIWQTICGCWVVNLILLSWSRLFTSSTGWYPTSRCSVFVNCLFMNGTFLGLKWGQQWGMA